MPRHHRLALARQYWPAIRVERTRSRSLRRRRPAPLPGNGIALQVAFVLGPRRVWSNLWKPTIDSLGSILGREDRAREWNARDGRITDLGVHCTVDMAIGNKVTMAIRASTIDEDRPA